MKIIDCFTFFNELDLLEIRLKILDECVDHFVIAESNLTHSGKPKPYIFEQHKERFSPWMKKISYVQVQQSTEGLVFAADEKKYNPESASWKLENGQRDALMAAKSLAADDDLVVTGDLDEIPDPRILKKLAGLGAPVVLTQLFHYYYLNCQNMGNERWWNGTIVCNGAFFKTVTPQHLRDHRNEYRRIGKAGWHFSYLGGVEKIKEKIMSFAHTEFNKPEFTDEGKIREAMLKGDDIFKRPGVFYKFAPLSFYPPFLRDIMAQYPHLLLLDKTNGLGKKIYWSIKAIGS